MEIKIINEFITFLTVIKFPCLSYALKMATIHIEVLDFIFSYEMCHAGNIMLRIRR